MVAEQRNGGQRKSGFKGVRAAPFLCPALAEHTVFVVSVRNGSRRVRSQRKSVDWGTMGPALGGAYECYAHISSFISAFSIGELVAVNVEHNLISLDDYVE